LGQPVTEQKPSPAPDQDQNLPLQRFRLGKLPGHCSCRREPGCANLGKCYIRTSFRDQRKSWISSGFIHGNMIIVDNYISRKLAGFFPTPVNSNILILSLKGSLSVQWFGLDCFLFFSSLYFLIWKVTLGVFCKVLSLLGFLWEVEGWCHSPLDRAESFIYLNLDTGEEWENHASPFLSQIHLQILSPCRE